MKDNGATFSARFDGQESAADVANDQVCISQGASRTISFSSQDFKSHRVDINIASTSSEHEFQFYGAVIETRIALLGYNLWSQFALSKAESSRQRRRLCPGEAHRRPGPSMGHAATSGLRGAFLRVAMTPIRAKARTCSGTLAPTRGLIRELGHSPVFMVTAAPRRRRTLSPVRSTCYHR